MRRMLKSTGSRDDAVEFVPGAYHTSSTHPLLTLKFLHRVEKECINPLSVKDAYRCHSDPVHL